MIGAEARASGFDVMPAGGVNISRDPRNRGAFGYAGEDPLLQTPARHRSTTAGPPTREP